MWGEDEFDVDEILANEDTAPEKLHQALIEAAQNGNHDRIAEILGNSEALELIDVDKPDETGSSALVYASCYSSEATVIELLRFGADPNVTDSNQWTPLMWAVQNASLSIVERLVEQGANVEYTTESGRSALSMCTPGSATYGFFSSQGYVKDESTGFYQAALDPTEAEETFRSKLEESSQALGISLEDEPVLEQQPLEDDFDWEDTTNFVLNPKDIPVMLDLLFASVPFSKGVQPVAANCLFLALRHYSYSQNEGALVGLVTSAIQRIEKATSASEDLKMLVYWLVQVQALIYYLQRDVKTKQETAAFLASFDNLLDTLFGRVVHCAKRLIEPLLKPCLLDFANIPGIDTIKYRGDWTLWRKKESPLPEIDILPPSFEALRKPAPRRVTAVLSSLLLILQVYSAHPVIIQDIFGQLLYWIGSSLFNSVTRTPKYMARVRAMQIRLNISTLEDWCHNNNQRPQDDVMHTGPPTYKSLDQLCKMHLASIAEILQWLQCFSGFGSDFTNVVAAMQELKQLNPSQLLYAAKHYRAEIAEPVLDKEYRRYLQELEAQWRASDSAPPERADGSILLPSSPIASEDIFFDENLQLPIVKPSFAEMLVFWGGGTDGSDTTSGHYFRPSIPAEISDELDNQSSQNVYEPLEVPKPVFYN